MIKELRRYSRYKRGATIVLGLAGIAVMAAYSLCTESCTYLRGSMLGLDLKYLGMFYMGFVLAAGGFGKNTLCAILLSVGLGGEVFLLGFQVMNGVYCPYCLAFAAVVLVLFAIHFERIRPSTAILFAAIGLSVFLCLFSGSATPAYAEETRIPSFGNGPVKVRIYTDYFCSPCRSMEQELEPIIIDLVRRRIAAVTFVDTPVHRETILYAKCFLGMVTGRSDVSQILRARSALFKAAEKNIRSLPDLEAFLGERGLKCRYVDSSQAFETFRKHLRNDRIDSTPSCVVEGPGGRKKFTGAQEILRVLTRLGEGA
ncbi:MAG: thioredoxin domain-containing protein [Syntrophaceae bacterium]|nr:thioredoxin domain-containing protein [Syntrophaceae bacterium]